MVAASKHLDADVEMWSPCSRGVRRPEPRHRSAELRRHPRGRHRAYRAAGAGSLDRAGSARLYTTDTPPNIAIDGSFFSILMFLMENQQMRRMCHAGLTSEKESDPISGSRSRGETGTGFVSLPNGHDQPWAQSTTNTSAKLQEAINTENALMLTRVHRREIQITLGGFSGIVSGPIDGIFGEVTRKAIRDWQAKYYGNATGFLTEDQAWYLIFSEHPEYTMTKEHAIIEDKDLNYACEYALMVGEVIQGEYAPDEMSL